MQVTRTSGGGESFSRMPPRGHSVQFHSREQLLLDSALNFLAPVLEKGEGAIVLAARERIRQIAGLLKTAGIRLDQLRGRGRYIELDAEDFLSAIMVGGHPDSDRFDRVMGAQVVRASRASDGRVAIFGEAISVLCSRGQTEAGVQLEQMWNDLAAKYDFALLCGYADCHLWQQDEGGAFARICAAHSGVLPEESYLELAGPERLRYVAELQQRVRALDEKVAERRHSEEALARSQKLAEIGRLAATIAHEINSPLTSLTNIIYLLSTHSSLDPAARRYVALADQELRRAARITKQVLGFYRESPRAVLCKMATIVNDVLDLYQPRLEKCNIAVNRDYRIEGMIDGFPSEMRQVIANLVGNAIDAIGSHGRIRVRVSTMSDWVQPGRRGVRVTIADSGPGISRENQKYVFHPFFTTKGESGTGLGLWLSSGIVRKHRGRLRLRSRDRTTRRGTVFSIFLPGPGEKNEDFAKARAEELRRIAA